MKNNSYEPKEGILKTASQSSPKLIFGGWRSPRSKWILVPLPLGELQQPLWSTQTSASSIASAHLCWTMQVDRAWEGSLDMACTSTTDQSHTVLSPIHSFNPFPIIPLAHSNSCTGHTWPVECLLFHQSMREGFGLPVPHLGTLWQSTLQSFVNNVLALKMHRIRLQSRGLQTRAQELDAAHIKLQTGPQVSFWCLKSHRLWLQS